MLEIPAAPADWPAKAALTLRHADAEFLRDQIAMAAPESMFAVLVRASPPSRHRLSMDAPGVGAILGRIRGNSVHAQNVSKSRTAPRCSTTYSGGVVANQDFIDLYRDKLIEWSASLTRGCHISPPGSSRCMHCIESKAPGFQNRHESLSIVVRIVLTLGPHRDHDDKSARSLVQNRERRLKGRGASRQPSRTRVVGGASSANRLQFRWTTLL